MNGNLAVGIIGLIEALAVLVLVGVTWWYARSTRKILQETERQADAAGEVLEEMARQARIMALSALVAARRGFHDTAREQQELEDELKRLRDE